MPGTEPKIPAVPAGFSEVPFGKLLQQIIDLERPMGLAYERAVNFSKESHIHDRHMIILPRGACRMRVSATGSGRGAPGEREQVIDHSQFLWVPLGLEHDDVSETTVYDTLALYPDQSLFGQMITDNGLDADDAEILTTRMMKFRRTPWLDALCQQYFFERVLSCLSSADGTYFLEKQILNELARIIFREKLHARPGGESPERTNSEQAQDPRIVRALKFVEGNLFQDLDLEVIAKASRMSVSTLIRLFRKEIGKTPYDYVRGRRLDEALALLKQGGHAVSDVAMIVGYEDFSAFSKAFRAQFGMAPSEASAKLGVES